MRRAPRPAKTPLQRSPSFEFCLHSWTFPDLPKGLSNPSSRRVDAGVDASIPAGDEGAPHLSRRHGDDLQGAVGAFEHRAAAVARAGVIAALPRNDHFEA